MKTRLRMGLFAALLCMLPGCNARSPYKSVDADEFERIIADTSVVCLDVRTAEEYGEGFIGNALNIDVLQPGFESEALASLPPGKTVALYCRSGRRSKKAAEILSRQGYAVVELKSGFTGWRQAGKAVSNGLTRKIPCIPFL